MRNSHLSRRTPRAFAIALPHISLNQGLLSAIGLLLVAYVGLMAFTMTYAVMHTEYAEQARDESAQIGSLESTYFADLAKVDETDYVAMGYVTPKTQLFAMAPSAPAVATIQQ